MILYGHSEAVAAFVAALLGYATGFGDCQAVGFLGEEGTLEAGVVYHNWNPDAEVIEISAASTHRRWLTRERLSAVFEYPFGFCRVVVARISERNDRALRIWRALGADEYRIQGLRGPDEAEMIFTLTREQWEESKFGQA